MPVFKQGRTTSITSGMTTKMGDWSGLRVQVEGFLASTWFECCFALTVGLNTAVVIHQTNVVARTGQTPPWVRAVNGAFLVMYSCELLLRLYVVRGQLFRDQWNVFDAFIVFAEVANEVMGSVVEVPTLTFLRVFRLIRVLRSVRILIMFPELHMMVMGLLGAMKSIFWGGMCFSLLLTVWAILGVMYIHPLNEQLASTGMFGDCDRCGRGMEDVGSAYLTFFQTVIMGDNWGAVCLPVIEHAPWTGVYFAGVQATVQLGMLNLILAVTVDRAHDARQQEKVQLAAYKKMKRKDLQEKMVRIFGELDADNSGTMDLKEILWALEHHEEFAALIKSMDIRPSDMEVVFQILDTDRSGDVHYDEFIEQLHAFKEDDPQTTLAFIKFYVTEIKRTVDESLQQALVIREDLEAEESAGGEEACIGCGGRGCGLCGGPPAKPQATVANGQSGANPPVSPHRSGHRPHRQRAAAALTALTAAGAKNGRLPVSPVGGGRNGCLPASLLGRGKAQNSIQELKLPGTGVDYLREELDKLRLLNEKMHADLLGKFALMAAEGDAGANGLRPVGQRGPGSRSGWSQQLKSSRYARDGVSIPALPQGV